MNAGEQPLGDLTSGGEQPQGEIRWGEPIGYPFPDVPLELSVDDADGDPVKHFAPGPGVEVWLTGIEAPLDPEARNGMMILDGSSPEWRRARRWVMPLRFFNYQQARHAATVLATVLSEINETAREPIPTRDDGHQHKIRASRFSRSLPVIAICELCMETLCDDLVGWARGHEIDVPYPFLVGEHSTIVQALERELNAGRPS